MSLFNTFNPELHIPFIIGLSILFIQCPVIYFYPVRKPYFWLWPFMRKTTKERRLEVTIFIMKKIMLPLVFLIGTLLCLFRPTLTQLMSYHPMIHFNKCDLATISKKADMPDAKSVLHSTTFSKKSVQLKIWNTPFPNSKPTNFSYSPKDTKGRKELEAHFKPADKVSELQDSINNSGGHSFIKPLPKQGALCIEDPNFEYEFRCYSWNFCQQKFVDIGGWIM